MKKEQDVLVAGKTWKYRPGTINFDPKNYHKVNIVGIGDRLNEGDAWQMDTIMSVDDYQLEVLRDLVDNKGVKKYGEAKVEKMKEITKNLTEPQGNKEEARPATPPAKPEREKVNRIGQRAWKHNFNPMNRHRDRPEGFKVTISNEAQILPSNKGTTQRGSKNGDSK